MRPVIFKTSANSCRLFHIYQGNTLWKALFFYSVAASQRQLFRVILWKRCSEKFMRIHWKTTEISYSTNFILFSPEQTEGLDMRGWEWVSKILHNELSKGGLKEPGIGYIYVYFDLNGLNWHITFIYRISSNKCRVSSKHHPLITAGPLILRQNKRLPLISAAP